MIRHIIIWDFKDELNGSERKAAAEKIKTELEALKGVIDGLEEIKVYIEPLISSNGDMMLDSTLKDEQALGEYAVHPAHVAVKDYISTVVKARKCIDIHI